MFFVKKKVFTRNSDEIKLKLHVGCGEVILKGWINLDINFFKGINIINDVREGLPFKDLKFDFIFLEHFLEHLSKNEGELFLKECFRILKEEGIIRLSTPNLDWVWLSHYRIPANEDEKRYYCEIINRAFYGWGHKFLYNDTVLCDLLKKAGFKEIKFFKYGESDNENLKNLERHPKDPDAGEISSLIIVQAYKY